MKACLWGIYSIWGGEVRDDKEEILELRSEGSLGGSEMQEEEESIPGRTDTTHKGPMVGRSRTH